MQADPAAPGESGSLLTEMLSTYDRIFKPTSTFGAALSQADQDALSKAATRAGILPANEKEWSEAMTVTVMPGVERDVALAEASGRWPDFVLMGETQFVAAPDSPQVKLTQAAPGAKPLHAPAEYVPGDIVAIRSRVARVALRRLFDAITGARASEGRESGEDLWAVAMARFAYRAVPYFLPAATAHGIMASVPPDAILSSELRLPYPAVAVFFSSDLEIPAELIGGEEALDHRRPPETPSSDDRINLPPVVRPALMTIRHHEPVALTGVVLAANPDASVSDFVLFIVRTPASKIYGHSFVEGLLSNARLTPLVSNLAAAVAWGAWTQPPDPLDLPEANTREFRKAVKRGSFRRREPRGAAAGVHVLEAPGPTAVGRREHHPEGHTHSSPVSHLRRGHWRRQRIGARSDWHYEGRWVRPTLVNPEGAQGRDVRVYRLPIPPADRPEAAGEGATRGR